MEDSRRHGFVDGQMQQMALANPKRPLSCQPRTKQRIEHRSTSLLQPCAMFVFVLTSLLVGARQGHRVGYCRVAV